jgi:hypothetical protein
MTTTAQFITTIRRYVQGATLRSGVTQADALAALDALQDAIGLMQQRYADKEAVRLGHIVREGMTPAQYHAAEQRARAAHPEAWAGRLPVAADEMAGWMATGQFEVAPPPGSDAGLAGAKTL